MKTGFVSIFGRPNAGKSTLLNTLMDEKLAIVSHKAQTTRHRIKGILNRENCQIVFSDTPGIIDPKYKLHERMMQVVKSALEDADVALLIVDIKDNLTELDELFRSLKLKVPGILVLNKMDTASPEQIAAASEFFKGKKYAKVVIGVSALKKTATEDLLDTILGFLPDGDPFYDSDDLTDLPTKFFVGEMIREKIFFLYQDEIPYHTTVVVKEYKEKTSLIKIVADIVVQRETQKGIILGEGGSMIRQLGTEARKDIEKFLGHKIFLELFVRVKPKWRDNDYMLREFGYS